MVKNDVFSPSSKVWRKLMKTWKSLLEKLQFSPSRLVESIKNVSLWWGTWFRGEEFGFSI
jgi:hypothetical protein